MAGEYPKAKYNVDGSTFVVRSEEEDSAQDSRQWFDHPDKAKAGPPPEPPRQRGRPPKVQEPEEAVPTLGKLIGPPYHDRQ